MRASDAQQKTETFHRLHEGPAPLVLVNAWDAASARIVECAGARAIGTTSAGMAWSLSGDAVRAVGRPAARPA